MMKTAEPIVSCGNRLGEGPVWIAGEQSLYWVDILGNCVHRYQTGTGAWQSFPTSARITALAPRSGGGWICATSEGFCSWDPEAGCGPNLEVDGVTGCPEFRFNDGKVDPAGRFWAGTMSQETPEKCQGALYCLNPDLSRHRVLCGFTISNGMDWSPDERTFYFTDTLTRRILGYPFDAGSGRLGEPETRVLLPEEAGYPDGLAVDEEGCLWTACWEGHCVRCYSPSGKLLEEVQLPVARVTSCAFGGEGLDRLFITTARVGLSSLGLSEQPRAGDLFVFEPGRRGRPSGAFAS